MGSVVHQQQLKVLDVVDEESLVAGGSQETGLLVGAIADLGHADSAPETSADTSIDTLGLSPAGTDTIEPVTLVTVEGGLVCKFLVNSVFQRLDFARTRGRKRLDSGFSFFCPISNQSNCASMSSS